ncbi:hypothetical protein A6R68_23205 [Neotoma lepida]|uniref:Uncharacterized protein n=1 Tax=Neotoma lepida TaxID=56216 RepID=A0A1A6HYL3_NEOLE|nr:hypothetical protein A6R68_23205 [Neotoma lepida]
MGCADRSSELKVFCPPSPPLLVITVLIGQSLQTSCDCKQISSTNLCSQAASAVSIKATSTTAKTIISGKFGSCSAGSCTSIIQLPHLTLGDAMLGATLCPLLLLLAMLESVLASGPGERSSGLAL